MTDYAEINPHMEHPGRKPPLVTPTRLRIEDLLTGFTIGRPFDINKNGYNKDEDREREGNQRREPEDLLFAIFGRFINSIDPKG
jgi:hypothetical protein